jgi:[ribosomal protein S18]-alanine N-acetyltransferase
MPFIVEPMRMADISQVEIIEREAFTSPWSRRAYEYDLAENPLAHYIVVRQGVAVADVESAPAPEDSRPAPLTWQQKLTAAMSALKGTFFPDSARTSAAGPPAAQVLGFAGIWMAVGEAHLVTIAVDRDWRRRGLGELLLVSSLDLATRLQASTMYLEVRPSNDAAKRLYEKYGYEVTRVRKGYYSDNGEDALEMAVENIDRGQYQARLQRLKRLLVEKLTEEDPEEPADDPNGDR